jgi:hypothetical protein
MEDAMSDDYLSDELMKSMMESGKKPDGEELVKILNQWFDRGLQRTCSYIGYRFLSWLIQGRVYETICLLEKPGVPNYSHLVKEIRKIGNKRFPSGAGAYIAHGLWGWLCIELGNPAWTTNSKRVLIVERPTTTMLEAYMEMIGGSSGKNDFFRTGFWRKDAATQEQFNVVRAIAEEQRLGARYLSGGGCWVSPRTVPLSDSVASARDRYPAKNLPIKIREQLSDFLKKKNNSEDDKLQLGLTKDELSTLDSTLESETGDQLVYPQLSREKDGLATIKTPHIIEVKTDKLYNIAADPSDFRATSMKNGRLDIGLYKENIKQAGYHGYHRDHPRLGPVIAAFEYPDVENIDKHDDIGIDEAIAILGKSRRACDRFKEEIKDDRGRFALDLLSRGKYFPALFADIEDDVCNFFYDEIHDEAEPVWQGTIYDPYDEDNSSKWYPVQACEYEGVFFAKALESDPEGYFASLEVTKAYISWNWVSVREDRDY